jgi:hypothetical protein
LRDEEGKMKRKVMVKLKKKPWKKMECHWKRGRCWEWEEGKEEGRKSNLG